MMPEQALSKTINKPKIASREPCYCILPRVSILQQQQFQQFFYNYLPETHPKNSEAGTTKKAKPNPTL